MTAVELTWLLPWAQSLADGWLPNVTCVMNVATVPQGPRVVDFNCVNCCRFYAHDLDALVAALTARVAGQ